VLDVAATEFLHELEVDPAARARGWPAPLLRLRARFFGLSVLSRASVCVAVADTKYVQVSHALCGFRVYCGFDYREVPVVR
jgi:hypothetical protein